MIQAIIFDCFGVLTTEFWHEFLSSLPSSIDIQTARDIHRAYGAGLISKQECGENIKQLCGKEFTELQDVTDGAVSKNMALLGYIKILKQHYRIGLLSNIGNDWVREKFLTTNEQALFDAMVFSFEVGANKPERIMYQTICDKLGVSPEQVIYIDDMSAYTDAAIDFGMQAIVYENFTKLKTDLESLLQTS